MHFSPGGRLKPPPNPLSNPGGGSSSGDSGLLLLLFLEDGLLLLFSKASNPLNEFALIILKCGKGLSPVFMLLIALFC